MRPIPTPVLTRGLRLTMALGVVCSAAALISGWIPVPGNGFASPSLLTSARVTGLSSLSNAAQTSVTQATLLISRLGGADAAEAGSQGPSAGADAKASALIAHMNAARLSSGTHELLRDPALDAVALARAQDLLALDYFDHYGPAGESAFTELRARGIRYRLAGENLARNNHSDAATVTVAFEALMASPGHHANIVEPRFQRVGVAAVPHRSLWLYVTIFTD